MKKLLSALLVNVLAGVLLCYIVNVFTDVPNYFIACVIGIICSAISLLCFFASWKSAPNGALVALFYALRLFFVFGSVIVFVFLPFGNALGAILPHLPTVPIIALFIAVRE